MFLGGRDWPCPAGEKWADSPQKWGLTARNEYLLCLREAGSSSVILWGMFPAQRCLHKKMRFILPIAVSGCFVASRVVLWWNKMLSLLLPTTENSIFSGKNAAKCFSTIRKKRFSAWSPILAISETLLLFFFFLSFFPPGMSGIAHDILETRVLKM